MGKHFVKKRLQKTQHNKTCFKIFLCKRFLCAGAVARRAVKVISEGDEGRWEVGGEGEGWKAELFANV